MAKKVLIVEDSPTQVAKVKILLENKNYEVFVATDGEEGLAKAAEAKPDLIVLDVNLPKIGGFDVCKRLKSSLPLKTIPVIMFSSENKLQNMVIAYEMGADYYIVKGEEGERTLTLLVDTVFTRNTKRVLEVF